MSNIKFYTEEQVNLAMQLATFTDDTYNQVLEKLTPIELPSDEEIEKAANTQSHYEGAMWFKYKILKPNYKNEEN
jgi:hypothetical protein